MQRVSFVLTEKKTFEKRFIILKKKTFFPFSKAVQNFRDEWFLSNWFSRK